MEDPVQFDFRQLLQKISDNLGNEDVEAMKFLCTDILPMRKLQDVTTASMLFQLLIEQYEVSKDNTFLVAELLYRIRQCSLLRMLKITREAVHDALPIKGTVSPYRQMLYEISENIGKDDHKDIIFLLLNVIPKKQRETMSTLQLLTLLETQTLVAPDKLDTLENICRKFSPDLVKRITKYKAEKAHLPSQETSPEVLRSKEESTSEPCQEYHAASGSIPCQTEDSGAGHPTKIDDDATRNVSHSLSQLNLGQASEMHGNLEELPAYEMGTKCRGYCVIINNEQFTRHSERKGTVKDAEALQLVFKWLGLEVSLYTDQTASNILDCMETYRNKNHKSMDCFVCCILSHGESGSVHGSDDESVSIKQLTSKFTAQLCPSLTMKPKLFFIQACQGKDTQLAVPIQEDAVSCEQYAEPVKSIPNDADFLLGMATVDGFSSFRHVKEGSWYIQSLCRNLLALVPRGEDILSILTKVNDEVSERADGSGTKKQMPQPAYTLRKKLIFPEPTDPPPSLYSLTSFQNDSCQ